MVKLEKELQKFVKKLFNFLTTIFHLNFNQFFFRIKKKFTKKFIFTYIPNLKSFNLILNQYLYKKNNHDKIINNYIKFIKKFDNSKIKKNSNLFYNINIPSLVQYNIHYLDFNFIISIYGETNFNVGIEEWISNNYRLPKSAFDPYVISLRIVNLIYYLNHNLIKNNETLNSIIYCQIIFLKKNIEYHLEGNHLISNFKCLVFGGFYFNDANLINFSLKNFILQLDKQVLNDGSHYEISPGYQLNIIKDILEVIDLTENNKNIFKNDHYLSKLREYSEKLFMNSFQIMNNLKTPPYFNDTNDNTSIDFKDLFLGYKKSFNSKYYSDFINYNNSSLSYQLLKNNFFYAICDVGIFGSDIQPGHAHSDNLSFELFNLDGKKIISNLGTLHYEKNICRHYQRSSKAHNTISVLDKEQIGIWDSFRVGRRKNSIMKNNSTNFIESEIKFQNVHHKRTFKLIDNRLEIIDRVLTKSKYQINYYFDANIKFIKKNMIVLDDEYYLIEISGGSFKNLKSFMFPEFYKKIKVINIRITPISNIIKFTLIKI